MADLVELVAHVDDGFLRPQDAAEVDRRPAHDDVAGSRVDRLLEFFDLLRAIAHGREDLPGVRILLVRLPDRTDRVADRADDLGGAESLGGEIRGAVFHPAMGQGRSILDGEHPLAADQMGLSAVMGDAASTMTASGLTVRMFPFTISTFSG